MRTSKTILGLVALAALTTFVQCTNKSTNNEKTCVGSQALNKLGYRGTSMPAKALALTFDDGPGARTRALSEFLKAEGIRATFFVNGVSMGFGADEILAAVHADGHLIANHTETHQSLTGLSTATPPPDAATIVKELEDTDAKITAYNPDGRWLFRPPFGDWDGAAHDALVASAMSKYVGPVLWDVGDKMDEAAGRVADWDCWQDGTDEKRHTVQECGDMYLTEIRRAGKGIVLMHDPYYNDADPDLGGTVEMVMYMVPILKAEGFTFMRVDEVPDIAKELPPLQPGGAEPGEPGTNPAGEPGEPEQSVDPANPCP